MGAVQWPTAWQGVTFVTNSGKNESFYMCEFLTGMIFVMWQYFLLGMKKNYVSVFFTKMNKLMRKYFEALLIPREDNFHTFHPQIDFQSTFF